MGAFRLPACGLAHAGEAGIGCFPSLGAREGVRRVRQKGRVYGDVSRGESRVGDWIG